MTTISEVYFLVRVGSWDEDDLEDYITGRACEVESDAYDKGHAEGHKEGFEEGQLDMQKEALNAIKGLV
jgi:flagellar biosynthesis/type III secretory pathway protein FliH